MPEDSPAKTAMRQNIRARTGFFDARKNAAEKIISIDIYKYHKLKQ